MILSIDEDWNRSGAAVTIAWLQSMCGRGVIYPEIPYENVIIIIWFYYPFFKMLFRLNAFCLSSVCIHQQVALFDFTELSAWLRSAGTCCLHSLPHPHPSLPLSLPSFLLPKAALLPPRNSPSAVVSSPVVCSPENILWIQNKTKQRKN